MAQNHQIQQNVKTQKVNIHELMEKMSSKRELYNFLSLECHAYLPKMETVNIYFLKQIMRAEKDYIKRQNVKVAVVPQIDGLTVEDIIQYSKKNGIGLKYLPNDKDWNHIDRKWLCDVIYTCDDNRFQVFINKALFQRKEKLEKSQNLLIEMRPEFVEALENCMNFSNGRGKAIHLLKPTSRHKRRREEMDEVKEEEDQFKKDKQQYFQNIKKLKSEQTDIAEKVNNIKRNEELLNKLHLQGIIDDQGNIVARK